MIDILLATYNGENYLSEQIESILNQTCNDYRILIRDDHSTDSTQNIISEYIKKYPTKIFQLIDNKGQLGSSGNFSTLIEFSSSEYVMFCDQDDVWLSTKVSKTLEAMVLCEKKNPKKGILIHSDLVIVDEQLNVIADSFFKYSKIDPDRNSLKNLLLGNTVTGCTVMINRDLIKMMINIPYKLIIHDYWLALCASGFGIIKTINEPLMLYRQHSNNVIGAQNASSIRNILHKMSNPAAINKTIFTTYRIIEEYLSRYSSIISDENIAVCNSFLDIENTNKIKKILIIIKNKYYKNTISRTLGLLWRI